MRCFSANTISRSFTSSMVFEDKKRMQIQELRQLAADPDYVASCEEIFRQRVDAVADSVITAFYFRYYITFVLHFCNIYFCFMTQSGTLLLLYPFFLDFASFFVNFFKLFMSLCMLYLLLNFVTHFIFFHIIEYL